MDDSCSPGLNPEALPAALAQCLFGSAGLTYADQPFHVLSAVPGAYALIIQLEGPIRLDIAALGMPRLDSGWYVYTGNAYGPGGLGARLRRHCRTDKATHWHVDRLTALGSLRALAVQPDGHECRIVETLTTSGDFAHPLSGFGASDCRTCQSHLLVWTGAVSASDAGA